MPVLRDSKTADGSLNRNHWFGKTIWRYLIQAKVNTSSHAMTVPKCQRDPCTAGSVAGKRTGPECYPSRHQEGRLNP